MSEWPVTLTTKVPVVYHPNHLLLMDEEIALIALAQLRGGTAILSEPLCEQCGEYRDLLREAREAIDSLANISHGINGAVGETLLYTYEEVLERIDAALLSSAVPPESEEGK